MDLQVIEENIRILEEENTSVENVQDLANLYIVYDKLRFKQAPKNSSQKELNDIMPALEVYIEAKRQNQLGQTNEEAVEHSLKLLCQELKEFIETLYTNTSSRKERLLLLYMIKNLNERFNK